MATEVIRWAAEELASLAIGVIYQLRLEREQFDVVLVGSLYNGGPLFLDPLRTAICAEVPGARFVRLAAPPVVGAVLLGMEQAGVDARAVRPRLIATAAANDGISSAVRNTNNTPPRIHSPRCTMACRSGACSAAICSDRVGGPPRNCHRTTDRSITAAAVRLTTPAKARYTANTAKLRTRSAMMFSDSEIGMP